MSHSVFERRFEPSIDSIILGIIYGNAKAVSKADKADLLKHSAAAKQDTGSEKSSYFAQLIIKVICLTKGSLTHSYFPLKDGF